MWTMILFLAALVAFGVSVFYDTMSPWWSLALLLGGVWPANRLVALGRYWRALPEPVRELDPQGWLEQARKVYDHHTCHDAPATEVDVDALVRAVHALAPPLELLHCLHKAHEELGMLVRARVYSFPLWKRVWRALVWELPQKNEAIRQWAEEDPEVRRLCGEIAVILKEMARHPRLFRIEEKHNLAPSMAAKAAA